MDARGKTSFNDYLEARAVSCAAYVVLRKATVRQTAEYFGLNKSVVHNDLTKRLPQYSNHLYREVRKVLDANKAARYERGGAATRRLWQERKNNEATM